jgi:hypothetical protein
MSTLDSPVAWPARREKIQNDKEVCMARLEELQRQYVEGTKPNIPTLPRSRLHQTHKEIKPQMLFYQLHKVPNEMSHISLTKTEVERQQGMFPTMVQPQINKFSKVNLLQINKLLKVNLLQINK